MRCIIHRSQSLIILPRSAFSPVVRLSVSSQKNRVETKTLPGQSQVKKLQSIYRRETVLFLLFSWNLLLSVLAFFRPTLIFSYLLPQMLPALYMYSLTEILYHVCADISIIFQNVGKKISVRQVSALLYCLQMGLVYLDKINNIPHQSGLCNSSTHHIHSILTCFSLFSFPAVRLKM